MEIKIRDYGGDLNQRWCLYYYENNKRKVIWISEKFKSREDRYAEFLRIKEQMEKTGQKPFNPQKILLVDALDRAQKIKSASISFRSNQGYRAIVRKLTKWLKENNLQNIYANEFTRYHAQKYFEDIFVKAGIKPVSINGYLSYLKSLFNTINEIIPITENPFRIKKLKCDESEITIWSDKHKKILADYLKHNEPEMFIITLLVYHCFIRPAEILQIRVGDVNLQKGFVYIHASQSKSKKKRNPTLSNQLIELLTPILADACADDYLFSVNLKPGPKRISRNTLSRRFREIRAKLNLPKDLKMYSFKHTGNSEMLEKGVNILELKIQNGHSDILITEKYANKLIDSVNMKFRNQSTEL